MAAHAFRFDGLRFRHGFGFTPRKPRHPLLRFVLGLVGLALLAVAVAFSVVAGAAMIALGLGYRLWRQRRGDARTERVMEAEYRVLEPRELPNRR